MLFRFNWLTLLANIVSLQFTKISEYQPSSSYRASKSRFFPYIHCKFCRVCPTTKMTSATVKPSITGIYLYEFTGNVRYWNFSFIVSERVQVNPDNSRAMNVLTFSVYFWNWIHCKKNRQSLSQPKPWCNEVVSSQPSITWYKPAHQKIGIRTVYKSWITI